MLDNALLALAAPAERPGPRQHVQARLEDAGKTLMMVPMPVDGKPAELRAHWPADTLERFWELMNGLTAEQIDVIRAERNRLPLKASPEQIARMEKALGWVLWIPAGPKRRIVFARSLIHPRSGKHVVSWRKLNRAMGPAVQTLQLWWEDGIDKIVEGLWRDNFK